MRGGVAFLLVGVLSSAQAREDLLTPQGKIGFDPQHIGEDGLYGPPNGRRALDYEFCIPASPDAMDAVSSIDPSARFYPVGKGRVGCSLHQVLVLGNTHQVGFREVLESLARLPYIERIEPAWFE